MYCRWDAMKQNVVKLVNSGVGTGPRSYSSHSSSTRPLANSGMIEDLGSTKAKDFDLKLTKVKDFDFNNAQEAEQAKLHALQERQKHQAIKMAKEQKAVILDSLVGNGNGNATKIVPKTVPKMSLGVLKCMRTAQKAHKRIQNKNKNKKNKSIDDITKGQAMTISEAEQAEAELEAANERTKFITHECVFSLGTGPLGMTLNEVDGCICMIGTLVAGGQAESLGFIEGDVLVSCGGVRIPQNKVAYDQVIKCLTLMPRPIEIIVIREGEFVEKWRPVRYTFLLNQGSLGMDLKETGGDHCIVSELAPEGQAFATGFLVLDKFIRVGLLDIPKNEQAYDVVLNALKSQPRPIQCIIERSRHELRVTLQAGPLGLSLQEIPPRCMVAGLHLGGQADMLGIQEGDCIISVGGKTIPDGPAAYDVVIAYLQCIPRPLEVILLREGANSY